MSKNIASRQGYSVFRRWQTWVRHIIFPDRSDYQNGFSVVEGLLIFIIVAILGVTGWYVYSSNKKTNNLLNSADKTSASTKSPTIASKSSPTTAALKEYKNNDFKFSFQYPSSWNLTEDISDQGRGREGQVYVTSPNGTNVHFDPNFGGKGGDCADDQANDQRTTRTCETRVILSVEKLDSSTADNPVYFYKASFTDPTRDGGKTKFFIFIGNGKYAPTTTGSTLGILLGGYDAIEAPVGGITISVEGKDDNKNSSPDFFNTQEVKEATPVLKSFKLL